MAGRKYSADESYRYGFNGKELDNEIKDEGVQYDYGFRIYDSRIGRFLSVDPLTSNFPFYSAYQFAGNKPIIYIDLDGLETKEARLSIGTTELSNIYVNAKGEFIRQTNLGSLPASSAHLPAQTKMITYDEFVRMVPPNCGFYIDPDRKGGMVIGPNGSWHISLIKKETPLVEDWLTKSLLDKYSVKASMQQVSTDAKDLTDEQLQECLDRILLGNGTDQDWQYWPEIQRKLGDGKLPIQKQEDAKQDIKSDTHTFTKGFGDKAVPVTVKIPDGFRKVKRKSLNQDVFTNGSLWITPDKTSHKGGVWKVFDKEKNVGSTQKKDRIGTYDEDFNRIDD